MGKEECCLAFRDYDGCVSCPRPTSPQVAQDITLPLAGQILGWKPMGLAGNLNLYQYSSQNSWADGSSFNPVTDFLLRLFGLCFVSFDKFKMQGVACRSPECATSYITFPEAPGRD